MNLSILQADLSRALNAAGRAVSTKTNLPVLNNVLLRAEGETLTVSGTNLEISVTESVPALIMAEGAVTIPAKLLTEFVAALPANDRVALSLDETTLTLTISAARFNANIKGISAEDYPNLPTVINTSYATAMKASVLKQAIAQTAFAASTDETRPVLTGIQAQFTENEVTFATADAFRLAVKKAPLTAPATDFTIILPARAMLELSRILPDDDTEVTIDVTTMRSQALFKTDTFAFTSSLISGTFPNYQQIMPKEWKTQATMDVAELTRKVKTAQLFAKDNGGNIVKVEIKAGEDLTPGSLTLTANASEVGDNRSDMDAAVEGNGGAIAFNAKYVADVLGVVGTVQTILEMQDATKPGVFKPVGDDSFVCCIMPMHLSANR